MPTVANPFGLKAKLSISGTIRPQRWVVPASDVNTTNYGSLYQDDAIYFDTNGRPKVSGTASAAAGACVGSFQGVEYNDSTGRRTVSNQFNPALVSNLGANSGLGTNDVWFWLYMDPELVFEIQGTASLVSIAGIGNALYYDQNAANVNTVTGFSAGRATATAGSATSPTFLVYNLAYDNNPNNTYTAGTPSGINGNSWTDTYPNVLVRLGNAQFNGTVPAF